jgi:S1-C subfamily serine protease
MSIPSEPQQAPPFKSWRLKPLAVDGWEGSIEPTRGRLTLGRSEDNDVVLDGEIYPSVSGHHTLIEFVEDELWVEDLGSRNGTYVNGETITRTRVNLGTQIQLGTIGPRFAVVSSEPLSQTMFVDPKSVRAAVGSVSESKVEDMVQSRARRTYLRVTLLSALLVALLGWWGTNLMRTSSDEISASLEEASAAQRERDAQVADELRLARGVIERLQELNTLREEERVESERKRENLALALKSRVDERESAAITLSERLGALEGDNEQGEEIQRLSRMIEETQAELREARTQLTSFNPVNLEQARLAGVSHVRRTVVLLEVEVALVNSETMELLYLSRDGEPNFDGRGIPVIMESSGSGFCVSEGGWILTNAHVADPHQGDLLALASELPIATQTSIYAVFSGTQERHHARLVKVADDDIDLALVQIDPFEGMPHLSDFNLESTAPQPGGDLYLLGFPLGNFALQEGRTVIASTFRGILSRIVDGSLQVDAGVHPGNSGGPITDPLGHVIGIVSSVQATPEQTAVYTIGYGIPIADAVSLWPPPETQPAEDE